MGSATDDPWQLVVEWFWLVHDEQSGKPLLSPTHTGLGLGAALLVELMVTDHIALRNNQVLTTSRRPPPDALAHQVLSLMQDEPEPLELDQWLAYLARTAREDVGTHLWSCGLVVGRRTRFRRERRWVPVDVNVSGRPGNHLRTVVSGRHAWSAHTVLLAGLSDATGLLGEVFDAADVRRVRAELPGLLDRLPPALPSVLSRTRVAVSAAVLAERR